MKVLSAIVTAALLSSVPALAGEECLKVRDIDTMTAVDAKTMLVNRFKKQSYEVKFRGSCAYRYPNTFFVYETWKLGQCLDKGDVLPTNGWGPCFIDSVTPQAKVAA